jgi:hypothetical protein
MSYLDSVLLEMVRSAPRAPFDSIRCSRRVIPSSILLKCIRARMRHALGVEVCARIKHPGSQDEKRHSRMRGGYALRGKVCVRQSAKTSERFGEQPHAAEPKTTTPDSSVSPSANLRARWKASQELLLTTPGASVSANVYRPDITITSPSVRARTRKRLYHIYVTNAKEERRELLKHKLAFEVPLSRQHSKSKENHYFIARQTT